MLNNFGTNWDENEMKQPHTDTTLDVPVLGVLLKNAHDNFIGITPRPAYGWFDLARIVREHFGPIAVASGLVLRDELTARNAGDTDYYGSRVGSFNDLATNEKVSSLWVFPYEDACARYASDEAQRIIHKQAWRVSPFLTQCRLYKVRTSQFLGECDEYKKLIKQQGLVAVRNSAKRSAELQMLIDLHKKTLPCITD